MRLSSFLAVSGAIGVIFGLEFLLVPGFALPQYGMPTEPHNLLQARYFGASLLPWSLTAWLARGVRDDAALRALLSASAVGWLLGVVLSLWAALSGLQSAMAWLSVAIYGVFLLGALWFLSSPARRA